MYQGRSRSSCENPVSVRHPAENHRMLLVGKDLQDNQVPADPLLFSAFSNTLTDFGGRLTDGKRNPTPFVSNGMLIF